MRNDGMKSGIKIGIETKYLHIKPKFKTNSYIYEYFTALYTYLLVDIF